MKRRTYRHSVEQTAPGQFKITLDKRAGSLIPGTANDPYMIAELMALDAIRADLERERDLEEMALDSDEDTEEKRMAKRREKERGAEYHSSDSGSALSRVARGIRSLADVMAGLLEGRARRED